MPRIAAFEQMHIYLLKMHRKMHSYYMRHVCVADCLYTKNVYYSLVCWPAIMFIYIFVMHCTLNIGVCVCVLCITTFGDRTYRLLLLYIETIKHTRFSVMVSGLWGGSTYLFLPSNLRTRNYQYTIAPCIA